MGVRFCAVAATRKETSDTSEALCKGNLRHHHIPVSQEVHLLQFEINHTDYNSQNNSAVYHESASAEVSLRVMNKILPLHYDE